MRSVFLAVALWGRVPAAEPATPASTPVEVLNFTLLDHRGRLYELRRLEGRVILLFFTANGCPIARQSAPKLLALRDQFGERGVRLFLVNANSGDDLQSINKEARELGLWHLPTLKDDTQGVTRHLGVRRTGEVVAISTKDWSILYRGALDDQYVEGAQKPQVGEKYLENALNEFLDGKPITTAKTVARGCLIHLEGSEGPDAAAVSYAREVVPILQAKCVGCHSPGNIGSWSMTSHRKVHGMSSMIEEVLLARRMPPWDADPHIGKFKNDASLTVTQAQTLLRWVSQGAPRGEGPDPLETLQTAPAPEWPLGQPDIVLRLPEAQQIPATGTLEYRHIEVSAGNTNEGWVGGVYVKPGNKKVLHHAIARLKENMEMDHLGRAEMFAGWGPGSTQGWFPRGGGKFLPKLARFDLELHYTTSGVAQTDTTEIGLYLLKKKPAARYESVPVVNHGFEIRPGDPNSEVQGLYCFPQDATLHSVTPHMHVRGRWMKFEVLFPDGRRETICSVPRYDFNWQLTYALEKPRELPAGTWVMLTGGFDNSARNPSNPDPHKTIHWGEQSWDEMFLGWYNVTWDPPRVEGAQSALRRLPAVKTP